MKKSFKEFYKNKKVLITGSSGFVGSWLCSALMSLNCKLYGIGLKPISKNSIHRNLSLYKYYNYKNCNINNYYEFNKVISQVRPQIIFHLASQPLVQTGIKDPQSTFKTNINGLINLFEIVRKIKNYNPNIIVITSDKAYENEKFKFFKEDDKLGGTDPYSASKSIQEIISKSYSQTYKIKVSTARAGNIIGGGDWAESRIITDLIENIYEGKKIYIRNPKAVRPWQYIGDVINGYLKLAFFNHKSENVFNSFNFSSNSKKKYTVNDIINQIEVHRGKKLKYEFGSSIKEKEVLCLNSSKARVILNWKSEVSFNQSIIRTLNWYDCFYKIGHNKARDLLLKEIKSFII